MISNHENPIQEEDEVFLSKDFEPEENEVNSGFPGFQFNSKKYIIKKLFKINIRKKSKCKQ